MTTASKMAGLLHVSASCTVIVLLTACGGGSGVATYDVSATAGSGGSISPSGAMVKAGGTTTFMVAPGSGYAISGVTGCGGTLSGNTYTTGAINANCTVTAAFVAQYTVTVTAATNGVISPTSAVVDAGGTTTFTLTPGSGYASSVTGCGGSLSGDTYTTGTINAPCTITVTFHAAFTWVGGSSTPDAAAVYGSPGVASAANMPGARDGGTTWTDTSGNLWLFGGFSGYPAGQTSTAGLFLNDLWKYSPSSNQWTYVGGPTTPCSQGVYGIEGMAAPTNTPGARTTGFKWTDAQGNLWLYGGGGCDANDNFVFYGDLWQFSSSSEQWAWVNGSSTPNPIAVYGTENVAAAANTPGMRHAAAAWMDASGNLWLFGGEALNSSVSPPAAGALNDLWVYSPSSNQWTWVGGTAAFNVQGSYGELGVAQASNLPGARLGSASWTDASGNFWLFGGEGWDATGQYGMLNDLWELSPATGEWTWMGGSDTINSPGVYGTLGVAAAANVPAARFATTSWTDPSGNFWLFGGEGLDVSSETDRRFNDFWELSPSTLAATWVAGSSTFDATGVYGTMGVAAVTNVPGARAAPMSWTDTSGNLWLFGGYQYDASGTRHEMNDLWKYPTQ